MSTPGGRDALGRNWSTHSHRQEGSAWGAVTGHVFAPQKKNPCSLILRLSCVLGADGLCTGGFVLQPFLTELVCRSVRRPPCCLHSGRPFPSVAPHRNSESAAGMRVTNPHLAGLGDGGRG